MPRPVSAPAPALTRGCYPDEPRLAGPGPLTSRAPEPEGANGGPSPQSHVRHSRTRRRPRGSRARPAPRPHASGGATDARRGRFPSARKPRCAPRTPKQGPACRRPALPALFGLGGEAHTASAFMILRLAPVPGCCYRHPLWRRGTAGATGRGRTARRPCAATPRRHCPPRGKARRALTELRPRRGGKTLISK